MPSLAELVEVAELSSAKEEGAIALTLLNLSWRSPQNIKKCTNRNTLHPTLPPLSPGWMCPNTNHDFDGIDDCSERETREGENESEMETMMEVTEEEETNDDVMTDAKMNDDGTMTDVTDEGKNEMTKDDECRMIENTMKDDDTNEKGKFCVT